MSLDCSFPPRLVTAIQAVIPAGVNGVAGFQIQNSGVKLLPYDSDDWFVGNNETVPIDLQNQITSGSWQVAGYNIGQNDHSFTFRFYLSVIGATPLPGAGAVLSSDDLAGPDTAIGVTVDAVGP